MPNFFFQMEPSEGGQWPPVIKVYADSIDKEGSTAYTLTLKGADVGEVRGKVAAWWSDDVPSTS